MSDFYADDNEFEKVEFPPEANEMKENSNLVNVQTQRKLSKIDETAKPEQEKEVM